MSSPQKVRTRESRERTRQRIIDAASELVRERSFAELNVAEVMARAGIGRTLFYRYFDDLGDLLVRAGRQAIEELYEAQLKLASTRVDLGSDAVREAIALPVAVYRRHGPVLRAVAEASAADPAIAPDQETMRRRFDQLVAEALRNAEASFDDVEQTARALNLLNESYLLHVFGRESRVSAATAVQTLTELWVAALSGRD
jgi:TetR/AcrR family transcriptional regulator, ethionamide resistance regulator